MIPLYIFDLDGTLADLEHRRHFVERPMLKCQNCMIEHNEQVCRLCGFKHPFKPNWDAFHEACVDDTPIDPVIRLLNTIAVTEYSVQIFSGRSESVRNQTVKWLIKHVGWCPPLKMRPVGDYTPDDVLKESWLPTIDRARLVMTFDDRDRVVAMWRRNGIICAQMAPGDF